jgi:hypothetical protein
MVSVIARHAGNWLPERVVVLASCAKSGMLEVAPTGAKLTAAVIAAACEVTVPVLARYTGTV